MIYICFTSSLKLKLSLILSLYSHSVTLIQPSASPSAGETARTIVYFTLRSGARRIAAHHHYHLPGARGLSSMAIQASSFKRWFYCQLIRGTLRTLRRWQTLRFRLGRGDPPRSLHRAWTSWILRSSRWSVVSTVFQMLCIWLHLLYFYLLSNFKYAWFLN